MPGKHSGDFPVPNDFGFNYPVDLVELGGLDLGFEGEEITARYVFCFGFYSSFF